MLLTRFDHNNSPLIPNYRFTVMVKFVYCSVQGWVEDGEQNRSREAIPSTAHRPDCSIIRYDTVRLTSFHRVIDNFTHAMQKMVGKNG